MRRVTREEDPAHPEPVGQGGVRAEGGGPPHLAELVEGEVGALRDQLAHRVGRDVRRGAGVHEARHEQEVVVLLRREQRDEVGGPELAPHVPVLPVQPVEPDVGEEHRVRRDGLAGHGDAERLADRAAPAVGRDQVGGAHRTGGAVGAGDAGRDAVRVLGEGIQAGAERDRAAQLGQPRVLDLQIPPLREQQHGAVRGGRRRDAGLHHHLLVDHAAVRPDAPRRVRPAGLQDGVEHAEVLVHLLGARLDAVAAGAGRQPVQALQDEGAHAAPGEVEAEGQAGGAGAGDQYVHVRGQGVGAGHEASP